MLCCLMKATQMVGKYYLIQCKRFRKGTNWQNEVISKGVPIITIYLFLVVLIKLRMR
jgi:hypothetical protein